MPITTEHVDDLERIAAKVHSSLAVLSGQAKVSPLGAAPRWYDTPANIIALVRFCVDHHDFVASTIIRLLDAPEEFTEFWADYQHFLKHLCPRCDGAGKIDDGWRCWQCKGKGRTQ